MNTKSINRNVWALTLSLGLGAIGYSTLSAQTADSPKRTDGKQKPTLTPAVGNPNAKCVLCVGENCYVIQTLNCSDLVLAPSDVCRPVLRQIGVEYHSPTEAYAVIDQKRYRLASDEAQAKFDEMLKQHKGKYERGEFERALAPVVARKGIISQARINAIANGGEVKELKQPRP